MTTREDVDKHRASGSWRRLHDVALVLCEDAGRKAGHQLVPALGGGTRLMLALSHRISDDIDLFINDPQWIGYLSPRLNDSLDALITGYNEEATSLKLRFPQGEIDFIVRMSLTGLPLQRDAGIGFPLEPCAEVLAKKLFYRGWALTPRDLFDWHAIEQGFPGEVDPAAMGQLLRRTDAALDEAMAAMPLSEGARRQWAAIQAPDLPALDDIAAWGRQQLAAYRIADAQNAAERAAAVIPGDRQRGNGSPSSRG